MSESNQVSLRYVKEVTYGTTPTNSADWQEMRFTSESLTATPETMVSSQIRADRMTSDQYKVGLSVSGGVEDEFSAVTYDDFLESLMCDTWTTDVLNVGTDDSSYTLEKEFGDINKFITFTGMRLNQGTLSLSYGAPTSISLTFAGNGSATPVASLVGTGSSTDATTTTVLNGSSDISSVKIDDVATTICLTSLTIDINNNLRSKNCLGNDAPVDQIKGGASVSGSVEVYLDAASFALYGNVLTQTDISLEYTIGDGVNSYTFLLPRVKLSGDAPSASGLDQDVMLSLNYTALLDPVTGTSLRVTRT